MRKFLARCVAFAKRVDAVNTALHYNPLYYGRVARLLRDVEAMDRVQRQALVDRLTERTLLWARAAGARMPEDAGVTDWPILEKDHLRDNVEALRNPRVFAVPASTGGTSGIPIRLWRSLRCIAAEQAFLEHFITVQGSSFRTARVASLRTDDVKPPSDRRPPFGIRTIGGRRLLLSSQHIAEDTIDWYASELNRFGPDILWILPNSGESLALRILQRGLKVRIPLILSTSEILHTNGRHIMANAFGAPVLECYGLAERVIFASSAKEGEFWINPAYGLVELRPLPIKDASRGLASAEIIATGFWNEAMPLVRYRTGDHLLFPDHYDEQDLNDVTLGLKPFTAISGRDKDYLISPRGELLVDIDNLPRESTGVMRMQVIQETRDNVRILVIPTPGFDVTDREVLMAAVRRKVPDDMAVTIELVDALERLPSGKVPYVIRRV